MALSEQSNSAEGPFRARCQSSQTANQGGFLSPAWQRNNCVDENCYHSFFLLHEKQLCFLWGCQAEEPPAFPFSTDICGRRPPRPIDEAHLEAPEETKPQPAARAALSRKNPTFASCWCDFSPKASLTWSELNLGDKFTNDCSIRRMLKAYYHPNRLLREY